MNLEDNKNKDQDIDQLIEKVIGENIEALKELARR